MSTYQNKGDYLFVEVSESYSLNLFMTIIHEVADHCQKEKLNKVLIDLRKMEGKPSLFDRYQTGVEIAKVWSWKIEAAIVTKSDVINHMTENAAINRGAKLFGTTDPEAALKWLEIENRNEKPGE
jgi:hypothetical protein